MKRIDQNSRRSRAIVHNQIAYLGGQVADSKSADITQQSREVFAKIDALLAEAGSDKTLVLTAQILLSDMADYDGFNAVWDAWVKPGETPTRYCAKVELADPQYRVEIVITAATA